MSPVVDSWSCPTTIYAGAGTIEHLPEILADTGGGRDRPVLLLTDPRVWPVAPVAQAVASAVRPAVVVAREPGEGDDHFLRSALAAMRAHPQHIGVALGGGSVLDVARLAGLASRDAAFAVVAAAPDSSYPMRMWPADRGAANPLVCIPTTLGTAAEVSPIAMLRRRGRTQMFVSPLLRSRAAILDPLATAGPDRKALLAGLLEPLSRVLVPAVTGVRLPVQDAMAAALVRVLLDLGDAAGPAPDEHWRLATALASSQTHTGFMGLGRSPFGHALWPFATELVAARGITKAAALASLMPAWLQGIATGQLGPAFGTAERVAAVIGVPAPDAALHLRSWVSDLGMPGDPGPAATLTTTAEVAAAVARGVRETWQAMGFFLPGASRADIDWLSAAALGDVNWSPAPAI